MLKSAFSRPLTVLFHFDFILPQYLYQWEKTRAICQLSLAEPFGLVPSEVRLLTKNGGGAILCSNRDGFLEQISHLKDGFLVDPLNLNEIIEQLGLLIDLSKGSLKSINKLGCVKVLKEFNYEVNLYNFLQTIL